MLQNNKNSSFVTQQKTIEAILMSSRTIFTGKVIIEIDTQLNQAITITISFNGFYSNLIVNESVKFSLETIEAMTLLIAVNFRWWRNLLFWNLSGRNFPPFFSCCWNLSFVGSEKNLITDDFESMMNGKVVERNLVTKEIDELDYFEN